MMQQRYRMDEDLDEYEDDFVEQDQYEDGEEDEYEDDEEEEEEEKPLSAEEIKYLELREKLKARHRSNFRRENGKNGVSVDSSKLMNFGSFFGPSKPVIADSVIQERKSMLENRHLTPKVSTSQNDVKKGSTPSTTASKNGLSNTPIPRQVKSKAQLIKQTRDYSFLLSDDAEIPKPANNSGPQKNLAPKNGFKDSRSAEVRSQRNESCSHSGKKGNDGYEQRKPSSGTSQIHDSRRAPPQRPTSSNRASLPCDSRRQLDLRKQTQSNQQAGSSNGSGSRPAAQKAIAPKKPLSSSDRKLPASSTERRPSAAPLVNKASVAKTSTLDRQRQPMGKQQSSGVNNRLNQNRDVQRSTENKMLKKGYGEASRQTVKPQVRHGSLQSNGVKGHHIDKQKPARQLQNSSAALNKDHRIKKRKAPESDDDEMDYRSLIRKMFRQPTQYYDDDEDDADMVINEFDTIMAEERRSAKIAKQEDDEELIKIQEEERQEMLRKKARMRKMQQRR